MERIPKTKAEFERLPFMSRIRVKEQLVNSNFAILCDSININDLKLFKPVLHKGDFEEIELMRSRCSKSRVAQQLLMDLPHSMKRNPSWFEVLDNLLRSSNLDLYYAINPWERRTVDGGASGGGGGGDGGRPQPPAPRGPRPPYPKSTPLSQTRGMARTLRPLCEGDLWRDLAEQLDLTHGDQLHIMNAANIQRCDLSHALLDQVIHRHGDGATVDMLVKGLFALEEKGHAVVSSMEELGLVAPQGLEGSEAEGAGLDMTSLPYDNVEGGSASAAAMMPPTPTRVAHPCSLGPVQRLADRAPHPVGPCTQSSPSAGSSYSPQEPYQAGNERLVLDGHNQDTRDRLQRSASELSPRDPSSSSSNIPVVSRAVSYPAGLTHTSLGFSLYSSTPAFTESCQNRDFGLNLDQTPPDSMEENSSQAKTSKEPFIPEDKALNVVRRDTEQEPSPASAHDHPPFGQSGLNLYRQTSAFSGSLQPDAPLSNPVVAVGGETGDERGPAAVIVTMESASVTCSQNVSSSSFMSEVIRESQESIISMIERFQGAEREGDSTTSSTMPVMPVSSSSQEDMQPAASTASGDDNVPPLEAASRRSQVQHKTEAEKRLDQRGNNIFIFCKSVNSVQVGENNEVVHSPLTPLGTAEPPTLVRTASSTSADGNVTSTTTTTTTSSCQTLPPPTEASHQSSDRCLNTADDPPPYSQVMAETGTCNAVLPQEMPNLCAMQAQSSASWDQHVTRSSQPSSTDCRHQHCPPSCVATLDSYGPAREPSIQPAPWEVARHETIPKQPLPQDSCQGPFSPQPNHDGGEPGGSTWPSQWQLQHQASLPQQAEQPNVEERRAQPESFGDVVDLRQFRSGLVVNVSPQHTDSQEEETVRERGITGCGQFLDTEERTCPQLTPPNIPVSEEGAGVGVLELQEERGGCGVEEEQEERGGCGVEEEQEERGGCGVEGEQEEKGGCGVEGVLSAAATPLQSAYTPPQSLKTIIIQKVWQTALDMFTHRKL